MAGKLGDTMQIGRYPKIYHYHIPKCGGTSIAWWLNQHVSDRRLFKPFTHTPLADNFPELIDLATLAAAERQEEPRRRQAFFGADVISTHASMLGAAPEGAFSFTVLRSPSARLLSQIADWRRLGEQDFARAPAGAGPIVADAGRLSVAAYLAKHGRQVNLFNNHITRAVAAFTEGVEARRKMSLSDLAASARETLDARLQFVGIVERPVATFGRLADLLGFAPEPHPPRMNRSDSASTLASEAEEAKDIMGELTSFDQEIYDHALQRFAARDAEAGEAYCRAAFETRHAADTVGRLDGVACGDDIVFSVRDPLVGSGFHGRDGAGLEGCCVWSGPLPTFLLYVPAPAGVRIALRLWVRGYANLGQRERLRVFADGVERPHRFEPAAGYAEALVVEARTTRAFVALEIDVGDTTTTGEPGTPTFEPRRRGLAFDRYGWRALPDQEAKSSRYMCSRTE